MCRQFMKSICRATNKRTYMIDNLVKGHGWKSLQVFAHLCAETHPIA
jgi:hypothetical protein